MLRAAVIGYGYWGRNIARVLRSLSSVELIAVSDTINYESELKKQSIKWVENYSDLLALRIDLVFICTPAFSHFTISKFFLEEKVHVFSEKPLTISSHEVAILDKLSKKNERALMVGHIFEYNPVVEEVKQLIQSNELGDIYYISMTRTGLGPVRSDVNVVYDLATHDISILNYWFNERPTHISAHGSCIISKKLEDIAFINLGYANKMKVNISVSWLDATKERCIKIVGSKKMVVFNDIHPSTKLMIYDAGISYQNLDGDFGSFLISHNDGDIKIPNIKYREPLKEEISHFIHCVLNNLSPKSNADKAKEVVLVLEEIQKKLILNEN